MSAEASVSGNIFDIYGMYQGIGIDSDKSAMYVGHDTANPWIGDVQMQSRRVVKNFQLQPLAGRQQAQYTDGIDAETGMMEVTTTRLNFIQRPKTQKTSGSNANVSLDGDRVITPLPEIYYSADEHIRVWNQNFGGQNRRSRIIPLLREGIATEEDLFIFQGSAGLNDYNGKAINGVIGGGTDQGNPTGAWGIDTGNNGTLDNMINDMSSMEASFAAQGFVNEILDLTWTTYMNSLAIGRMLAARTGSNLEQVQRIIRGGRIRTTNNIQASVSTTSNTAMCIARARSNDPVWGITASGLNTALRQSGTKTWEYFMGEVFTLQILRPTGIRYYDGLSNATS